MHLSTWGWSKEEATRLFHLHSTKVGNTESQTSLAWKGPYSSYSSTPLAWAGAPSTRPLDVITVPQAQRSSGILLVGCWLMWFQGYHPGLCKQWEIQPVWPQFFRSTLCYESSIVNSINPYGRGSKKPQPHSSDESFCREQILTLCCPLHWAVLSVRGTAQMVYAESLTEQRWCFSTRAVSKHLVHNLTWKYAVCSITTLGLFFRLACLRMEAFVLKLYLWKKCDFCLLYPVFGFCFIWLLAYLLLTQFCGFLHNHYPSGSFWVKAVLRLKWHVERDYHCSKEIFFWRRDTFNLDVTANVSFDTTLGLDKPAQLGLALLFFFLKLKLFFDKYSYLQAPEQQHRTRGQSWL